MIAQILVIKRLPIKLSILEYIIPKELETQASIGSLVKVPFKNTSVYGIIFDFADTDVAAYHKSIEIVYQHALLSSEQLTLIKTIAFAYHVPIGFIGKLFLPPLQSRKLQKIETIPFEPSKIDEASKKITTTIYTNTAEHLHWIDQNVRKNDRIVFVVPTEQDVMHFEKILIHRFPQKKILTWYSSLSTKEKFTRWFDIRNNTNEYILIGTKSILFTPIVSAQCIAVDYEHSSIHKSWDQSPLYSVPKLAGLITELYNQSLSLASFSPSVEAICADLESLEHITEEPEKKSYTLADIHRTNFSLETNKSWIFSDEVLNFITHTPQATVIIHNRKGHSTYIYCPECKKALTCPNDGKNLIYHESTFSFHCHYCKVTEPLYSNCKNCNHTLSIGGIGVELILEQLSTLFSKRVIGIFDIEKISSQIPALQHDTKKILIGTQQLLPYIPWQSVSLIIVPRPDEYLEQPHFLAHEELWQLLASIQYFRKDTSQFIIQTQYTDHYVLKNLNAKKTFYTTELAYRRDTKYPPFVQIVKYMVQHTNVNQAKRQAEVIQKYLQETLTKAGISGMIKGPFAANPELIDGVYHYIVLLHIETQANAKWYTTLAKIHQKLPFTVKVDPHPLNLLTV